MQSVDQEGRFSDEQLLDPKNPPEIVAAAYNDVKSSEWVLSALQQQWYESLLWYYGEQYMEWNYRTRRFQQRPTKDFVPRTVTNYMLGKVETGIAIFKDSMPRPRYSSQSRTAEDKQVAEAANHVMRYRDDQTHMERKKRDIAAWTVVTGNCFAMTYEDKANAERVQFPVMKREIVPLMDGDEPVLGPGGEPMTEEVETEVIDPNTGQPMQQTAVLSDETCEVVSPFEIVPDWTARFPWEFRRYTHYRYRSIDWIADTFGSQWRRKIKADRLAGTLGNYQMKVLDLITRATMTGRFGLPTGYGASAADWRGQDNSAMVLTRYELPTGRRPQGRLFVVSNREVIHDGEYPYGDDLNLFMFRWSVLPGSPFGFGMPRNLQPIQRRLNGLDTQNDLIRKREGNPQWLIPIGSKFSKSLGTSEPGATYTYKHRAPNPPPQRLDGAAPNPYNQFQRREIIEDIDRVSGIRELMEGGAPSGIAGVTADLLLEQAAKRFQPAVDDNRDEFKRLYMARLRVAQKANAWKVPRKIPTGDEGGQRDLREFQAADFTGNLTVDVEAVPFTAYSTAFKQQRLKEGVELGLVEPATNPQHRTRARHVMGLSEFDEQFALDYRRAEEENARVMAGQNIERGPYDDDEIHVYVHTRDLKANWDRMTEGQRERLIAHIDAEHAPWLTPPAEGEAMAGGEAGPGEPAGKPGAGPKKALRAVPPAGQAPEAGGGLA